jgi:glutathione S-transferase
MASIILHHYEMSPFSEKVRRILAFKRLAWQSVRAPAVMPKPDLVALTGGYRRIPVLQSDNHVYCDTSLIAQVLERLAPTPSLYGPPLAQTLAEWADSTLFEVTVPVAFRPTRLDDIVRWLTPDEMNAFASDRKAMGDDARRKAPPAKISRSHLPLYLARFDAALARTPYLLGEAASIADFSVYHCAWFVKSMAPEILTAYAHLQAWMQRIAAFEGDTSTPLTSTQALELCKQSPTQWAPSVPFADPIGLSREQRVVVRALDYGRDPVEGELVGSSPGELVLRRQDERAGTVYVHFPRLGYEISAVKPA